MTAPMRLTGAGDPPAPVRPPFVAGAFYPAGAGRLEQLVVSQLSDSVRRFPAPRSATLPAGILVPHAGLEYSGVVAAAAWRTLTAPDAGGGPLTVVLLGTNHAARWLDGVGVWDRGAWSTPLGEVLVEPDLAAAIVELGSPFSVDLEAHLGEHSLEVQLPFLQVLVEGVRIVPLAVSAGDGTRAIDAGGQLGRLVAARRAAGQRVVVVISTDMAHYPPARGAGLVTAHLRSAILGGDPAALATAERGTRSLGIPGLVCGMCGIEPAVMGLAALHAMRADRGMVLAEATSADAGGPADRTVGYLAARFD
jgi:AmmeMemoRadiSam system protein B